MTTIKSTILEFVEKNNITMIPRWKIILYSLLGIGGLFFTFLALVFMVSLIVFVLSKYGFIYMPLFGMGALTESLQALPLLLFICTLALICLVEILARRYAFSFRKPVLITLLGVTLIATFIGFLVALSPLHTEVRSYARDHKIGFVLRQYDRPGPRDATMLRGVVIATTSGAVTIQLFNDATTTVYASTTREQIMLPALGDDVIVFGRMVGGTFEAVGIRQAPRLPFEGRGSMPLR